MLKSASLQGGGNITIANKLIEDMENTIKQKLGDYIYGTGETSMEKIVGMLLSLNKKTIAVAESVTGGLVAKKITDVPGSSNYFLSSMVTYSNESKIRDLKIPEELIKEHGAVSEQACKAMALAIKNISSADIGLATTGIAGPVGGVNEKSVGLAFIGLATELGCKVEKYLFSGTRDVIRIKTAQTALDMVRRHLITEHKYRILRVKFKTTKNLEYFNLLILTVKLDSMRCFIAIPLSSDTHQELSKIQSRLKETEADVGWVKSDNIHLTLKFLGDVEEEKTKIICKKLREMVNQFTSFETDMGKLGTFPSLSNPRVIWIGLSKNADRIIKLQQRIEEVTEPLGFEKETRPFHPHLTLGRVRGKKNIQKLVEKLKSLPLPQFKPITVDRIILFQSILKPTGAEYTALDEFKLMVDPVRDLKNAK